MVQDKVGEFYFIICGRTLHWLLIKKKIMKLELLQTLLSTVLQLHIAVEFSPAIFVSLCAWLYLCFITDSNS